MRDESAKRKGAAAKGRKEGRLNPPFVVLMERAEEREQRRAMKGEGKKGVSRASGFIPLVGSELGK